MRKRSIAEFIILSLITFGIYTLLWLVSTKIEMNQKGAKIPTAWLLIVPFANIYWYWKYSEAVEMVTKKEVTTVIAFLLILALQLIGMAVIQYEFNKTSDNLPVSFNN